MVRDRAKGAGQTTKTVDDSIPNLYEILQVSARAETEVIEAAYKRLALKYHPDRNADPQATLRMQELNAAYAILGDTGLRLNYDRELAGLPPLANEADEVFEEAADTVADEPENVPPYQPPHYDWDDLPFAQPKGGAANPKRGLAWFKILVYRQRRQWLPWLLAGLLLGFLLFMTIGQNGANDQKQTAQANTLTPLTSFKDNFEDRNAVAQNWTLEAPWHLTNRSAASGSNSLWVGDEQTNQYAAYLNATVTLNRPFDLTHASQPTLNFKLNGQFDSQTNPTGQDRLFVEIAEPGQDFTPIFSISNVFNNWQATQVDLTPWKGKIILLRFRFQSNALTPGYTGPFIDDVSIKT